MTEHPEMPGVRIDKTPPSAEELRKYAQQALSLATIVPDAGSQAALVSMAQEMMKRAALLDAALVVVPPADTPAPPTPRRDKR